MDAPNMTQQVPERQRKRKLPQVSLQDNFNPIDLIKSQETLALFTKSLAENISDLVEAIKYAADNCKSMLTDFFFVDLDLLIMCICFFFFFPIKLGIYKRISFPLSLKEKYIWALFTIMVCEVINSTIFFFIYVRIRPRNSKMLTDVATVNDFGCLM
jgi:hypothetical protein